MREALTDKDLYEQAGEHLNNLFETSKKNYLVVDDTMKDILDEIMNQTYDIEELFELWRYGSDPTG